VLIETNPGYAGSPQVAIDPSGNALAVFTHFDGTRFDIASKRFE
jgi:hypothetical protein